MINPVQKQSRILKQSQQQAVLQNGQIVQGSILKIHPQNKAEIQVGQYKMVAEVTTPLVIGEKYFFRVEHADSLVQLRVIGEPLKADTQQNITQLMDQLGIKTTRQNTEFVQALINEKVPFDSQQLTRAVELLNSENDRVAATNALKEMLQSKLPLSKNVLHALMSRDTNTMTQLATELIAVLKNLPERTESQQKLLNLLENLHVKPPEGQAAVLAQIVAQINGNSDQLLKTLQLTGAIELNMNSDLANQEMAKVLQKPSGIQHILTQLIDNQKSLQSAALRIMSIYHPIHSGSLTNEAFSSMRSMLQEQLIPHLPEATRSVLTNLLKVNTPENQAQIQQVLQALQNQETYTISRNIVSNINNPPNVTMPVQEQFLNHLDQMFQATGLLTENNIKNTIGQTVNFPVIIASMLENQTVIQAEARAILTEWHSSLQQGQSLTNEQFALLKQQITERILPHMSQEQASVLMNQLQNNNQVQMVLQSLADSAVYEQAEKLVFQQSQQNLAQIPLELRQALQAIGLPFEQMMQQNTLENQPETIKSLLLQMAQQGDSTTGERGQQLVHFINGLQIQSVQETVNLLHAQIQLPAEKIGLNKDLFMQFEGRKTEDGKINPDYCRILFVLDLEHMKETIVDMHVQKRVVSVTIFSDANEIEQVVMNSLKKPLAQGLAALDYQLTSVKWERLHEQTESQTTASPVSQETEIKAERFDFRI